MVYGTVRQLGGTTKLASAPGRGTTATLLIPRAAAASVPETKAQAPTRAAHWAATTILLTDDDPDVRRFTAETLGELGYEVIEASNAATGLQVLQGHRNIDLLIVDYAMPGMTGAEMVERCRILWPHLPIVVFTGYAELPPSLHELVVVRKPASGEALAEAVDEALRKRTNNVVPLRAGAE